MDGNILPCNRFDHFLRDNASKVCSKRWENTFVDPTKIFEELGFLLREIIRTFMLYKLRALFHQTLKLGQIFLRPMLWISFHFLLKLCQSQESNLQEDLVFYFCEIIKLHFLIQWLVKLSVFQGIEFHFKWLFDLYDPSKLCDFSEFWKILFNLNFIFIDFLQNLEFLFIQLFPLLLLWKFNQPDVIPFLELANCILRQGDETLFA